MPGCPIMMAAAEGLLQSGGQGLAAAGQVLADKILADKILADKILMDQPQVYWLPSDTAFLWAWGLMLVFGFGIQALGLFFRKKVPVAVGAALVCGAAVMDKDPTLFVGQVLLIAGVAIAYASRAKKQRAGAAPKADYL
ncbi:MAG: hypothetical protein PHI96_05300 [Desulfovibrio sp.]|nr:hypothetical protein [Desulfovibrio sp.]